MIKLVRFTVVTLVALALTPLIDPLVCGQTTATALDVKTAKLRKIEDRVLPPALSEGPAAHETLPEYYWAANGPILKRLEQSKNAYHSQQDRPFRSVTLIAGVTGVGKTFLKGEVVDRSIARDDIFKCDLRELYEQWEGQGLIEQRRDLYSGDLVINTLPAIRDQRDQPLKKLLATQTAHFYIIDSLDEVHPDDYVTTLRQVVEFAFEADRPFVHVVVLGRPFAFRKYWQTCCSQYERYDVKLLMLNAPQLRTTGDLLVSSWNYHTWKYKLQFKGDDGELVMMPLEDYLAWKESGFRREGRFSTVECEPNDDMDADVQQALHEIARKYRVTMPMLQNLAGNSILREIIGQRALKGHDFDESEVAIAYLAAWMDRENKADDRPARSDPEHLALYVQLLAKIANKYLDAGQVDEEGFFEVAESDTVSIDVQGKTYSFPVERTITHSGLKQVDPRIPGVPKYRFYPIWIHRLLVEPSHQRLAKTAK